MGNEIFRQQIDEELLRLQDEIKKTEERIAQATGIVEQSKKQQLRLIQELKAVDLMKQNLGQAEPEQTEQELQQPPEGYNEEQQ